MKRKQNNKLNIADILVVAFGAMIGWGWVVSSGIWIEKGGVIGTILGFVIGGIMIYFIGLTYSELTSALPLCGGINGFCQRAFGKTGAFFSTWAMILSYVGVVCFEAVSLPTILRYIFPNMSFGYMYTIAGFDVYLSWILISIVFSVLLTVINFFGVKTAAILQTVLTLIIAAVGIMLFAASVVTGDISNIESQAFTGKSLGEVVNNISAVAMLTPFFLFGFDVIPQVSEEINVPHKKIGLVMLLSIILAVLFYAIVVLGIGFVFNTADINNSLKKTGLVTADAMAKAFHSSSMAKVMIIGGICGIVTSWNSFLLGGSHAIYSVAASEMIPAFFAKKHIKYRTPYISIISVGLISVIAPFFGRTLLIWIVNAANFACCLAYCIVSIAFLVLRKKEPNLNRPFKIKHYKIVGITAIIMSALFCILYTIPGTGSTLSYAEWVIIGIWTLVGILLYSMQNKKCKKL